MSAAFPCKFIIGLTGNIATGKSLARRLLAELGAFTIDADQVAHEVIGKGQPAYAAILQAFGNTILDANGEIVRSKLGDIVFAEPAALRRLEAITHPAVRERIAALARAAEADVVVIEAIKLLEGELRGAVDAVWVVDAPPATRLARLIEQRGMTKAAAQQRIAAQNSQADKLAAADVIIRNHGSIAETRAQIQQAWQRAFATEAQRHRDLA
ncbi:MAG: dephospho-CoA kinase [Chloroflexi bacterium]|nr:dephospho-CoA kinase [Chloroflexota bacterium]MCY3581379.1 dephospho-CoA kinase [Chloroflexota bacterium]MCY3717524.1 dephospho-CoA kinase [Chloroflexota bacterium]MDE2651967.1 dephospho-CoA kinase [Chloroflexota bacterium]MXX51771.1 dephospho-CoA kinase [Chloroflexota bacterium]